MPESAVRSARPVRVVEHEADETGKKIKYMRDCCLDQESGLDTEATNIWVLVVAVVVNENPS